MVSRLYLAASHLKRLVFPPRCACCNLVVAHNRLLCEECEDKLPRIKGRVCTACGRQKEFCGKNHRFEFIECAAPFYYTGPACDGIRGLKFRSHRGAAVYFGMEMAETVRRRFAGIAFDLVVCVPLSEERRIERGYNQAALLAQEVADRLEIPFEMNALSKLFDNKAQHDLSGAERRGNVLGVYEAVEGLVRDKVILLVDDIETTGSTLNECAKMLKLRGADKVYALTACIVLSKEQQRSAR